MVGKINGTTKKYNMNINGCNKIKTIVIPKIKVQRKILINGCDRE